MSLAVLTCAPHAAAQQMLTLEQALARAVEAEPGLAASAAGIDAARGRLDQASARRNPSLSLQAEDFGGSGTVSGADAVQTTAAVTQTIELGGDRRARVGVAEGDLALARSDAVIRRLDTLRTVQEAFAEAAAAAARRDLAAERLAIAEAVRAAVSERVEAARDPAVALARAGLEIESARAALEAAVAAEETARLRLAGFWGASEAAFAIDLGRFFDPDGRDGGSTQESPDVAHIEAEQQRADALVDLETARAVQDVAVGAGIRHFADEGDVAFVAEVSIPIALFDRNRGAIAAARADRTRLAYEVEAARLAVLREVARLERERSAALAEADALAERVIPQAEQALAQARQGYAQGAFSSIEVIDAQRALHEAREARVDVLAEYHFTVAALDRLTARFADPLPGEETLP